MVVWMRLKIKSTLTFIANKTNWTNCSFIKYNSCNSCQCIALYNGERGETVSIYDDDGSISCECHFGVQVSKDTKQFF